MGIFQSTQARAPPALDVQQTPEATADAKDVKVEPIMSEKESPAYVTSMYTFYSWPSLWLAFIAFSLTVILKIMNNQWQGNFATGFLGLYTYQEETVFFNVSVSMHVFTGFSWIFLVMHQIYTASNFNKTAAEKSEKLRAAHRWAGRYLGIPVVIGMVVLAFVASAARSIGAPLRVQFFSLGPASISGIMIFVNFVLGYHVAVYKKDYRAHKGFMFYMLIWTFFPGVMRVPAALVQFMVPTCNTSAFSTSLGLFSSGVFIVIVALYITWKLEEFNSRHFKINIVAASIGLVAGLISTVLNYEGGGGVCFEPGYSGTGGTDF